MSKFVSSLITSLVFVCVASTAQANIVLASTLISVIEVAPGDTCMGASKRVRHPLTYEQCLDMFEAAGREPLAKIENGRLVSVHWQLYPRDTIFIHRVAGVVKATLLPYKKEQGK